MTNDRLATSYLEKASVRLKTLTFLHEQKGYSDVVREAQECVELLLKAVLRQLGLEVPKNHDVSRVLMEAKEHLPRPLQDNLDEIVTISRTMRKERELAFYGTEDWIPTEEYTEQDSKEAIAKTEKIYQWVFQSLKAN